MKVWRWSMLACCAPALCSMAFAGKLQMSLPGASYGIPATSIREARFSTTVAQRYDFSCGSAALATLLTFHYGQPVSEQAVFDEMYRNGDRAKIQREGFSLLDMKRYLDAHGLHADGFEAPLEALSDAQVPAIVLITENGFHHFVVVKGLRDGRVLIGDPAGGTRTLPQPAFEAVWGNRVLFVVTGGAQPGFNTAGDWHIAPLAPLAQAISREGLAAVVMPRNGPSDF